MIIGLSILSLLLVGCSSFEICIDTCHQAEGHELKCQENPPKHFCFMEYSTDEISTCFNECKPK